MAKQKYTKNNIIQFILLMGMLVVLPVGTWYYLKSGFDFRKEAMVELNQNYGQITAFRSVNQSGKIINKDSLLGKAVAFYFMTGTTKDDIALAYFDKMSQQFDKRDDVAFVTIMTEKDSLNDLEKVVDKYKMDDGRNWYLLSFDENMQKHIQFPQPTKREDLILLADKEMTVRNFYDVNDKERIDRLIEHITFLMPKKAKRPKPVLKREKEK